MTEAPQVHGVSVVATADPVRDLPLLTDELVRAPQRLGELLTAWRHLVAASADRLGGRLWDLVPQNLLCGTELTPIDLEWSMAGCEVREVVMRGVLVTADHLATRSAPDDRTVHDLVIELVEAMDLPDFDLAEAIAIEARFQAIRKNGEMDEDLLRARTAELTRAWYTRLADRLGPRA